MHGTMYIKFSGEVTCLLSRTVGPSETLMFQSSIFFFSLILPIGHSFCPVYTIDLETGTTSSHIFE